MFTFQSTWWRLLQILLFHIPVEIAYRNQRWTSYLSYQHSSFFAWISTFSRLLISFTTKSYVDSLTDSTELLISVSVEEESFYEKWLLHPVSRAYTSIQIPLGVDFQEPWFDSTQPAMIAVDNLFNRSDCIFEPLSGHQCKAYSKQ